MDPSLYLLIPYTSEEEERIFKTVFQTLRKAQK